MEPGNYIFGSSIAPEKLQINVTNIKPAHNKTTPEVNQATKTIPLQKTGIPIGGLIIGILSLFGGIIITQKK